MSTPYKRAGFTTITPYLLTERIEDTNRRNEELTKLLDMQRQKLHELSGLNHDEAVKQLVELVTWFKERPKDQRKSHHRNPPTMPMPWRQQTS